MAVSALFEVSEVRILKGALMGKSSSEAGTRSNTNPMATCQRYGLLMSVFEGEGAGRVPLSRGNSGFCYARLLGLVGLEDAAVKQGSTAAYTVKHNVHC